MTINNSKESFPSNREHNHSLVNQRSKDNKSFCNITSHSTLPQIDNLYQSRNPVNLRLNPGTDFLSASKILKLDSSIKSSKASLMQLIKNDITSRSVVRKNNISFINNSISTFANSTQRGISNIIKECKAVNNTYLDELKQFEKSRERIHKYSNNIDFICNSLGSMPAIEPKVLFHIL